MFGIREKTGKLERLLKAKNEEKAPKPTFNLKFCLYNSRILHTVSDIRTEGAYLIFSLYIFP